MDSSFLSAKLVVPRQRGALVVRERLLTLLQQALGRKAVLVLAPAGSGKTTLVAQWVSQSELPVAWLSLETSDDDPLRFLTATLASIRSVEPDLGSDLLAALQAPQGLPFEAMLTRFVNVIAEIARPIVLVWDDYHVLSHPRVHEAALFVLHHLPEAVHLVVLSRSDPPWPLARLRARQDIAEVRVRDLRFTLPEAGQYLNRAMGLDLAEAEVEALSERTEGWIAGLQMAALSLQGRDTQHAAEFVRAFAGTHRFVVDFLMEEVLARQGASLQNFLLKTSVLDSLCAPLCDALLNQGADPETGRDQPVSQSSASMLEELEHANLFLLALDDERRWYRYHHLFADLLRQRLALKWPDRVPVLHSRASTWYEAAGLLPEAARHALAAGDVARVAHLAQRDALAMFDRGELLHLARWLSALPPDLIQAHPWLAVARAWTLAYAGPLDGLEPLLAAAQSGGTDAATEEGARLAGHLSTIRAYAAWLRGEGAGAADQARQALVQLPRQDAHARALAATTLGAALCDQGDLAASVAASQQSLAICEATGITHVNPLAAANLGYAQYLMGQLHAAGATCRRALGEDPVRREAQPQGNLPAVGSVWAVLSQILLEWNDLGEAERSARRGLALGRQWGHLDTIAISGLYLASILVAAGQARSAIEACDRALEVGNALSPWYRRLTQAAAARVRLSLGDLEAAGRWAHESGLRFDDDIRFHEWSIYRTLALVQDAQGRPVEALAMLERLLPLTEAAGAQGLCLHLRWQRALALHSLGRTHEAVAGLHRPLTLAEPEGYLRSFVFGGARAAEVLRAARDHNIAVDYVARLLSACGESERPALRAHAPPVVQPPSLVDPLSQREVEVLRLLATALSFSEISGELSIAVSTARTHAKSIYAKLGAHGRLDAVERGRALGLL